MDIKHSLLRIAAALILLSSTMLACSLTTNTYHRADNQLVDSEGPEVLPRKPSRFNKWIRIGLSDLSNSSICLRFALKQIEFVPGSSGGRAE